jgi:copper chaperone
VPTISAVIPDLSCAHCAGRIRSEISRLPGVREVQIEIETRTATFSWDQPATWEVIAARLREIDYPPQE